MIIFDQFSGHAGRGWGYPAAPVPVLGSAFVIDPAWQANNTKFYLDAAGTTMAYGDAGMNNWTPADLANALNASAANAPAPYQATVWSAGANFVQVVSGPIPSTLDLVSVPISISASSI